MEFEIDSEDGRVTNWKPTSNRTLFREYRAMPSSVNDIVPPTFSINEANVQPIKDVRVRATVSKRQSSSGLKPCYLYAEILPKHLIGIGQQTKIRPALAKNIRQRGKGGDDDCGHIIAAQFGGKMEEFNLFPQAKNINRGTEGMGPLWRRGVEAFMYLWLTFPDQLHPKVKFEMILFYECTQYPDRPNKTKFVVTFELDDNQEEEEEEDGKEKAMCPILKAELLNQLTVDVSEELKGYSKLNWDNYASRCGNNHRLFARLLKEILLAILEEGSKARVVVPPRGSNRPFSVWSFVPIVSDVRSIRNGIEDAVDGNVLGATTNIAFGLAGLAYNAVTLGTSGLLTNLAKAAGKQGVEEAGKQIVKEVVKEGVKEAGKQVAKEGVKEVAKEVVKEGVKEAGKQIVKTAAEKVAQETAEQMAIKVAQQMMRLVFLCC